MRIHYKGKVLNLPDVKREGAKPQPYVKAAEFVKGSPFGGPSNGRVAMNSANWDK